MEHSRQKTKVSNSMATSAQSISIRKISALGPLFGEVAVPGDKSISHRALIFGALADGETQVENFLPSQDTLATEACLKALGISIQAPSETGRSIAGKGIDGFSEPENILDARNSGTTMRILMGLLAGQDFFSVLTGDISLRQRPMDRIAEPLRKMGAGIVGRSYGKYAPLAIHGGKLRGITYKIPVVSAQVKSSLMLAALQASGETILEEIRTTRDHTERLFHFMGHQVQQKGKQIRIVPGGMLTAKKIVVPGDFSSAAFFLVAGLCAKGSKMQVNHVGLNPTRTAFLDLLKRMEGNIEPRTSAAQRSHEPEGTLIVSSSALKAVDVLPDDVPGLIDELPVFAVAASQAHGVSTVSGASELRVKESDRIKCLCLELRKMGANIEERHDGFEVTGPAKLRGAEVDSHGDHRLAMALGVAGILAKGETVIHGAGIVGISFPNFFEILEALGGKNAKGTRL